MWLWLFLFILIMLPITAFVIGISIIVLLQCVKYGLIARQVKLADLKHNSDFSRLANVTDRDSKRVAKYQKAIAYLIEE